MSGDKYFLDTNAVLYLLNGDETLAEFLYGKQLYISVITELELLGFKNISTKEHKQIVSFLSDLVILNITDEIKEIVIELRRSSNLKLPDCIIAATSLWLRLPFVTSDKQFKTVASLDLIYYEK